MPSQPSLIVVDDDEVTLRILHQALVNAGCLVTTISDPLHAMEAILAARPAAVIVDIMMSGLDGFELCRRIRDEPTLAATKVLVHSGKRFDQDRERAFALGANDFVTKGTPVDALVRRVLAMIHHRVVLQYWGVRGTLPVCGQRAMRYGGNTSCVSLTLPDDRMLVFDAGSGIHELSRSLLKDKATRLDAMLFISHPHWDHINALPFFTPFYQTGNRFEIFAPAASDSDAEQILLSQMEGVHFPITKREFAASMRFHGTAETVIERRDLRITTMALCHPGACLGYRVEFGDTVVCYITDNELFARDDNREAAQYMDRLAQFVHGADILITDTTYTDESYQKFVGWGHSCVSEVAALAARGEVGAVHLFHHDPSQSDDDIDAKQMQAAKVLADLGSPTVCVAPAEGARYELGRS